ncbi:hypothetical protein GX51_03114 [Blastomyces parvus]|uniref:Uncharacterized protein n=1 Tax=Blastomyces parvus TaxID=2060905 RepID=A0A2B7X8C5_9EURO|nr:hypothetical protein GX51_03114 [Blastomyces parvus]
MKSLLLFTFNILLLVGLSHSWSLLWHDVDNDEHLHSGETTKGCTKIDMSKGRQYKFDPKGTEFCVHMFADDKCEEENGWSCLVWGPRNLGQAWVRGYLINTFDGHGNNRASKKLPSPTTTTSKKKDPPATDSERSKKPEPTANPTSTSRKTGDTATTTAPTTLATHGSTTAEGTDGITGPSPTDQGDPEPASSGPGSSPPPSQPSEGGSSMSGGAIAGTAIGVCAGVGVLAAFGFLAYRRRRTKTDTAPPVNSYDDPLPPPPPEKPASYAPAQKYEYHPSPSELDSKPTSQGGYPPPPPFSAVEKDAGSHSNWAHVAELPDNSSAAIAELPASPPPRRY